MLYFVNIAFSHKNFSVAIQKSTGRRASFKICKKVRYSSFIEVFKNHKKSLLMQALWPRAGEDRKFRHYILVESSVSSKLRSAVPGL